MPRKHVSTIIDGQPRNELFSHVSIEFVYKTDTPVELLSVLCKSFLEENPLIFSRNRDRRSETEKIKTEVIIRAFLWVIWCNRNNICFQGFEVYVFATRLINPANPILMDVSSSKWLSELEMEEYCDFKINPHQMSNPYIDAVAALSSESLTDYPNYLLPMNHIFQQPVNYIEQDHVRKEPKSYINKPSSTTISNRMTTPFAPTRVSSSNTFILSFGNPNSPPELTPHQLYDGYNTKYVKTKEEKNTTDFLGSLEGEKRVPGSTVSRNETQAQDHVLAERKRREILTRRFIALSALLPNLKKMDKATVLEDATKYIKQLQTRMKELEEETTSENKRFKQESAISIKRSKISGDSNDDINIPSSDDDETSNSSPNCDTFNPEIEVRISERSILVRIYTHKNPSVAMKILGDMERLHLTISSSSAIPFSSNLLLITITAQMNEECELTAMDVVKCLQSAIRSYI